MPAFLHPERKIHGLLACALLLSPALNAQAQTAPTTVPTTAPTTAPTAPAGNAPLAGKLAKAHPVARGQSVAAESPSAKNPALKSVSPAGLPSRTPAAKAAPVIVAGIIARANSDVNGSRFTLGEIADIQCKDKALAARLAAAEIGTVALPGQARLIGPGDITVHLRANGLGDLLDHRQIELIAPPEMRVTRAAHTIASDEITRAAIASVQSVIAGIPNATLEAASAGVLKVPVGNVRVVAGAYRGLPDSGTITVPVSILVDGNVTQTADVTLRIRRKMRAVVARRTLEPHDLVSADDVTLALVDIPTGLTHPLADATLAAGKRATRRILQDAPLSADWLETPPDLKANTRVTIEYVFGSIHITAPGLTQQAGMIGDTIRVYAQDTRKELSALIVDDHTVQLIEAE